MTPPTPFHLPTTPIPQPPLSKSKPTVTPEEYNLAAAQLQLTPRKKLIKQRTQ